MSVALARTGSGRIINRPRQASVSSVRSASAHLSPPPFGGVALALEMGDLDPILATLDISREYFGAKVLLEKKEWCVAVMTQAAGAQPVCTVVELKFSDANAYMHLAVTANSLTPEDLQNDRISQIVSSARLRKEVPVELACSECPINHVGPYVIKGRSGQYRSFREESLGDASQRYNVNHPHDKITSSPVITQIISTSLLELDVITPPPIVSASPDSTVLDAMILMSREGVSSIAVLDPGPDIGILISTVTVTDIGQLVIPSESKSVLSMKLSAFVSEIKNPHGMINGEDLYPVYSVLPTSSFGYTIEKLLAMNRVFVADEPEPSSPPFGQGNLKGVVSLVDVLAVFARCLGIEANPGLMRERRRRGSSTSVSSASTKSHRSSLMHMGECGPYIHPVFSRSTGNSGGNRHFSHVSPNTTAVTAWVSRMYALSPSLNSTGKGIRKDSINRTHSSQRCAPLSTRFHPSSALLVKSDMSTTPHTTPGMGPTSPSCPSTLVHQDDGIQTPRSSRNTVVIEDQSSRLPFRKLLVVFLSLFVCLFVSFLDQTSVSTVLPAIAHDLGAADRINWVAADIRLILGCASVVLSHHQPRLSSSHAQSAASAAEGPLIGGALSTAGWRWVFWFTVPISITCIAQLWWLLPQNELSGNFLEKVRKVDFMGSILSLASIVLILVPISGGGTYYSWNSALVIAMVSVGSVLVIIFLLVEWRIATLPILPLHLFRVKNILIIYMTTIMTGIIYYCNLYFLPSYYTDARGFTPIQAAGLQSTFDMTTSRGKICGYLILQGIGVGGTLQTSEQYRTELFAAQASVAKEHRAVVTGARNFCTTAKNAELKKQLRKISELAPELIPKIIKYGPEIAMGTSVDEPVRDAYANALHTIFVIFIPIAGLSAVLAVFLTPMFLPGDKDVLPTAKAPHSANEQGVPLEPLPSRGYVSNHSLQAERMEKHATIPSQ
ncbi:TRI12 domain-containing protein [Rhizoctonia solani AG-1 IA]|uniref:TRI12 domain-containing protein n=1 Tax=Thanatephorus cucumeris (strain AG1-IA) TaxID=983506 RepID=L8X2Q6_THACA|nr:TRI12 domain-containing protein [Rhizoctonia solani AG-1 IA]